MIDVGTEILSAADLHRLDSIANKILLDCALRCCFLTPHKDTYLVVLMTMYEEMVSVDDEVGEPSRIEAMQEYLLEVGQQRILKAAAPF